MKARGTNKSGVRHGTEINLSRVRSAITNGSSLFAGDVDQRSAWARRFRDLIDGYATDLGGEGALGEGQRAIIRRIATIQVQLELIETRWAERTEGEASPRQLAQYQRASNSLRRLLESLGLHQAGPGPRDITPRIIDLLRDAAEA